MEYRHILMAILAEATESIEKLQPLPRRRSLSVLARAVDSGRRKNTRLAHLSSRNLLGERAAAAQEHHTRNHLQLRTRRVSESPRNKNLPLAELVSGESLNWLPRTSASSEPCNS